MKTTAVLLDIKNLIAEQAWDNYEMASFAAREFARMGYRAKAQKWDYAARASLRRHFAAVEEKLAKHQKQGSPCLWKIASAKP